MATETYTARPIVKWAGGKGYLLPKLAELLQHFPCARYDYYEPMVGGAAVFFRFAHQFRSARISDANLELINLYRVVRDDVAGLIKELRNGHYFYRHKSEARTLANYRSIRASDPTDAVKRAARIIYLLKTCFNGLMRVNSAGRFNVPPGSYRDPTICDVPALRAAALALAGVTISGPEDAIAALAVLPKRCCSRTLLIVDPPYHGGKVANGGKFAGYSGEFDEGRQALLVKAMLASGCPFIYTNRATDFIMKLFKGTATVLETVPLTHSIQPRYTTGVTERELVASYLVPGC